MAVSFARRCAFLSMPTIFFVSWALLHPTVVIAPCSTYYSTCYYPLVTSNFLGVLIRCSSSVSTKRPPLLLPSAHPRNVPRRFLRFGACSWIVDRNPLSVRELFDAKDVVYLSPDADHPLEEVLDSDVYVVGGIVDRNHSKGLTLAAAEGARARALRLPFDEHLPEVSAKDRVLTVVACVGVLMGRHAGGTWKEVLERSLPRRGKGYDGGCQTRGGAWRGTDGSGWGPRENAVDLKDL